jgi:hypothetical protein
MSETSEVVQPSDDSRGESAASRTRRLSGPYQALAWVGIVAGGLFIVAGIFFAGYFLSYSEHMGHMAMGHMGMSHESKDCCADMMPGAHAMKPGAMMGPNSGR